MINKNKNTAFMAWILVIVFLFGIFAPGVFGIDGMDGGFALSFGSFFIMICCIVTAVIFGILAREQDRMMTGRALLAHWSYDQKTWDKFYKDEYKRTGEDKKYLFYIIAGWAIFFGIVFPIFDPEYGIFVTYVMLGLIALIWVVMKISIYRGRNAIKTPSDAYISRFGVYFAGTMLSWRLFASRLIDVEFVKDKDCNYINFSYQSGRSSGNIRVPVPVNQIVEAKKIAEALKKDI